MTFSPFGMNELPFVANIVDYSIPYNIERAIVLTHVTNEFNSNIFSYFSAFNTDVWVLIFFSLIIIVTIVSVCHQIFLIKKYLTVNTIFELFLKFYANFLDKCLFKLNFMPIFLPIC